MKDRGTDHGCKRTDYAYNKGLTIQQITAGFIGVGVLASRGDM